MNNSVQQNTVNGKQDRTQTSRVPEIKKIDERAPLRIQNTMEMYIKIEKLAADYNIMGNIEIDSGHSLLYQVQVFFMTYYQKLVIESSFGRYN